MPHEMRYFTAEEQERMERAASAGAGSEPQKPGKEKVKWTADKPGDFRKKRRGGKMGPVLVLIGALILFLLVLWLLVGNSRDSAAAPSESQSAGAQTAQPVQTEGPAPTEEPAPTETPVPGPNVTADDWFAVLASPEHPLPDGFDPQTDAIDSAGYYLDGRAVEAFFAMQQAAQAEGLQLKVISGFRSAARQQALYDELVQELTASGLSGEEAALQAQRVEQQPYQSDHNTGLAVDLVPTYSQSKNAETIVATPEYQWLVEHAAEYGFVLRYPEHKQEATGVEFKPWHWRYVGEELAGFLVENDLTLDEYWQQYLLNE